MTRWWWDKETTDEGRGRQKLRLEHQTTVPSGQGRWAQQFPGVAIHETWPPVDFKVLEERRTGTVTWVSSLAE